MSEAYTSIKRGLEQAIQYEKGNKKGVRVYNPEPVNVKEIRESIGMTQVEFSASLGISLGTLRHWERGDRIPSGPALVLLNIIAKQPKLVLQVLSR